VRRGDTAHGAVIVNEVDHDLPGERGHRHLRERREGLLVVEGLVEQIAGAREEADPVLGTRAFLERVPLRGDVGRRAADAEQLTGVVVDGEEARHPGALHTRLTRALSGQLEVEHGQSGLDHPLDHRRQVAPDFRSELEERAAEQLVGGDAVHLLERRVDAYVA